MNPFSSGPSASGFGSGNAGSAGSSPSLGQTSVPGAPSLFGTSQTPGFGGSTGSAGQSSKPFGQETSSTTPFGQSSQSTQANVFGQVASSTSVFGQTSENKQTNVFGQVPSQSSRPFGQPAPTASSSLFGKPGSVIAPAFSSGGFGSTPKTQLTSSVSSSNLFGQAQGKPGQSSGQATGLFGQSSTKTTSASSPSLGLFGQTSSQPSGTFGRSSPSSAVFGQTSSQASGTFGRSSPSSALFGQTSSQASGTFGRSSPSSAVFGQTSSQPSGTFGRSSPSSAVFGQTSAPAFGQSSSSSGVFGQTKTTQSSTFGQVSGPFGQTSSPSTGVFGQTSSSSGAFGQTSSSSGPFGQTSSSSGPFGQTSSSSRAFGQTSSSSGAFGQTSSSSGAFGQTPAPSTGTSEQSSARPPSGLFAVATSSETSVSTSAGLFGKGATAGPPTGLFGRPQSSSSGPKLTFGGGGSQGGAFGHGTANQQPAAQTGSTGRPPQLRRRSSDTGVQEAEEKKPDVKGFQVQDPNSGATRGAVDVPSFPISAIKTEDVKQSGSGLFGKGGSAATMASSGLGSQSRGLFGKPPKEEDKKQMKQEEQAVQDSSSRTLFGKPMERENRGRQPITRTSGEAGSRMLFGKKVEGEEGRQPSRRNSDEDVKGRRLLRRMSSTDDPLRVAIVCKNVATKFNTGFHLRKHFSRYGEVAKVYPNTSKMQATVHFRTHEAAVEAKQKGHTIGPGVPRMTIFWGSHSGPGTPKSVSPRSSSSNDSESSKKRSSEDPESALTKRRRWKIESGVNEELESMSGTQDIKTGISRARSPTPGPVGPATRAGGSVRSPERPKRAARSTSPVASMSVADNRTDKELLKSFTRAVARTTTERVQVLELRDKFIRQYRKKKSTPLAMANVFKGTCLDMCPEKERYDREDKRRLGSYEWVPGTENIPGKNPAVDHFRAVKEYLRSSPDQDDPLPHELRPSPVLNRTMLYLLREVADKGEDGRWADWFDFLWNRTRGIRKDITQQQLFDQEAVALVEKCVRFHIYCSHRLCEEDMHSFDAKINNENLTKGLQTLKEMYHDLEVKQKCFCPTEAEFRAYTVLMNLNEGDTLRQVQQLRPEVRNTRHVNFVLQVYFALNNNNYIRFFRLVKEASFPSACIMHRYFTQVRNRALISMMRGYSAGTRPAQIPLEYLVGILGFEDEQEASDFCEYYGFIVKDGDAVLDRAEYIEPETAWPARRSKSLIETKRMVSVGEMINGEPFADTDPVVPSSSFDANGHYVNTVELPVSSREEAELLTSAVEQQETIDQRAEVKLEPSNDVPEQRAEVLPPKPKPLPNEIIKELAKNLFWEVIDEMCLSLGQEEMRSVQYLNTYSGEFIDNLLNDTVSQQLRSLCQDVYNEQLVRQQKAELEELEWRKDRVAAMLSDFLLEDMVIQESRNLATIEVREVHAKLKKEQMERCTDSIQEEIVLEVAAELASEVSVEVYDSDVTQRLKQLEELEGCVKLARAGRFLQRWKREYEAVKQLKRSMLAFPCAPSMEGFENQVKAFIPNRKEEAIVDGRFYVNKRARLTVESPAEVSQRWMTVDTQVTVHDVYRRLKEEAAWQAVDFAGVVGNILLNKVRRQNKAYSIKAKLLWKLLLCLPSCDSTADPLSLESVATRHLCHWLKKKFSKGAKPPQQTRCNGEIISLYRANVAPGGSVMQKTGGQLGVCIRTIEGTLDREDVVEMEESRTLFGAAGLLFVLPADPPFSEDDTGYWEANIVRLTQVLRVAPTQLCLPLVVVVPVLPSQRVTDRQVLQLLQLDQLVEDGMVGNVHVHTVELNERHPKAVDVVPPPVSEKLCESLQWLARETTPPPQLRVQFIRDFIEDALLEQYFTPVLQNWKKRRTLGHLHQDRDRLLDLYNAVIEHLAAMVTSERLTSISWPVPEFTASNNSTDMPAAHWNSPDHQDYLGQLLLSLRLPELSPLDPEVTSWLEVSDDIFEYLSEVVGMDTGAARVNLFSRLRVLLRHVEEEFEETCFLQEGVANCEPSYFNVPWADVLSACIDYRLATTDFADPNLQSNQVEEVEEEIRLAYFEDDMRRFRPPHEWRHAEPEKTITEKTPSLDTTVVMAVDHARQLTENRDSRREISIVLDSSQLSQTAIEAKKTSGTLLQKLQQERRRSDHFQKYLESVLHDGSVDTTMDTMDLSVTYPAVVRTSLGHPLAGQSSVDRDSVYLGESFLEQTPCQDLEVLPGQQRSEVIDRDVVTDPVAMRIFEPTIEEKFVSLKEGLASSRRDSDLFEQRLKAALGEM